nr:putative reverse transcriptase domain-containing protein [Tanacetum cinerariifolium]
MYDMMLPRRRRGRNSQGSKGEESETPFFEGDSLSSDEQLDRPRRNQREDNRQVFEFKEVPENKRVSLIVTKLRGRASAWRQQLKLTRERVGKPRVTSWRKMKKLLWKKFIPHNHQRSQIMESINMFDLVTLSDAYQCALAFEKQNRRVRNSFSPATTGGSFGLGNEAYRFVPNQARSSGGNTGPVSKGVASSGLKCFKYGEPGHRQSEQGFTFVVDPGSYDDLIVEEAVQKLGQKTKNHSKPYKLQWLKKGGDVTLSKRVLVAFFIRTTYKDSVWCDVVPMDACHLLLGRPWEYDRNTTHNERANTYSFLFDGVKITLMPNKPKELVNKPTGTLLTLSQFQDKLKMGDDVLVLIGKEVAKDSDIPEATIPLLKLFSDVFPDELPDGLPPLHDIQHHIDLKSGRGTIFKVYICESMSPSVVPALLTLKKDGSWRMYVDSRAINKITMRYRFPIPRLDDLLDQISGASVLLYSRT